VKRKDVAQASDNGGVVFPVGRHANIKYKTS
jgi:hypothetical protein